MSCAEYVDRSGLPLTPVFLPASVRQLASYWYPYHPRTLRVGAVIRSGRLSRIDAEGPLACGATPTRVTSLPGEGRLAHLAGTGESMPEPAARAHSRAAPWRSS